MKYNNSFYKLSEKYYDNILNYSSTDSRKKFEIILKKLLKEFKSQLEEDTFTDSGVLRTRICRGPFNEANSDYRIIKELIDDRSFELLASEYCIYLARNEKVNGENYNNYFEILWDYKTYYEQNKDKKNIKKKTI